MNGKESLIFTEEAIYIEETMNSGEAVMHSAEKALMVALSNIVTRNGGDILEIGFGMHLSADEIQKSKNLKSHTIIEIHPEIYKNAIEWAKNKPNTKIILGDWIDILPTLNTKFDGILHDTHRDFNITSFLKYVKPLCNKNCIVGFYGYPVFDNRLNGIRLSLDKDCYEKLPYKINQDFIINQYELKYTIYNGNTFVKEFSQKSII